MFSRRNYNYFDCLMCWQHYFRKYQSLSLTFITCLQGINRDNFFFFCNHKLNISVYEKQFCFVPFTIYLVPFYYNLTIGISIRYGIRFQGIYKVVFINYNMLHSRQSTASKLNRWYFIQVRLELPHKTWTFTVNIILFTADSFHTHKIICHFI